MKFQVWNNPIIFFKVYKNTEKIKTKVSMIMVKNNNGKIMLLSKCAICGSKISKFMKEQEAKGILISQSIKTPLSRFHW